MQRGGKCGIIGILHLNGAIITHRAHFLAKEGKPGQRQGFQVRLFFGKHLRYLPLGPAVYPLCRPGLLPVQ